MKKLLLGIFAFATFDTMAQETTDYNKWSLNYQIGNSFMTRPMSAYHAVSNAWPYTHHELSGRYMINNL